MQEDSGHSSFGCGPKLSCWWQCISFVHYFGSLPGAKSECVKSKIDSDIQWFEYLKSWVKQATIHIKECSPLHWLSAAFVHIIWSPICSTVALVRGQINEFFDTHLQTDRQQREALSFKQVHRALSSRGDSTRWHGLPFVISLDLMFHLMATCDCLQAPSPPLQTSTHPTMEHGLPCIPQVEPFSELVPATADKAASKIMPGQHSDWEHSWTIPNAEGAEISGFTSGSGSQRDRVRSERERQSLSMFPSEV